jgi:Zn finger protein HypA/HybF involved in hydrogenase expression
MKTIRCQRCWKEIEARWARKYCNKCRIKVDDELAVKYVDKHRVPDNLLRRNRKRNSS